VILAHLGNGASLAAVRDGACVDTTMGFTPAAGVPMSTRTGDIDPGLLSFFSAKEQMTTAQFQHLVTHESGLLGVSETSSDIRDLLKIEASDIRAQEAVALFCQEVRKRIGSLAAVLGGLDTLVFAAGIGENAPIIRERICRDLEFLGVKLAPRRNRGNAAVISPSKSRVTVRVIRTDEEIMIAQIAHRLSGGG
jgi:acetate kinase